MKKQNPRLGKCYEVSYKYITEHHEYTLVHGIITDNKFGTGKSLDHAWVEKDDQAYDVVLDLTCPKEIYYDLFSAEPMAVYTVQDAMQMAYEQGTYGPWDDRLKKFQPVGFNVKRR
jgi:hypothetical protein